jgi:hypothetical protein
MTFAKLSNGKISTKTVAGLTTGIGKATITATTGSPTVDTTSRAGKTIYKFTGSGSITVGTAGNAEILLIGGGGGGGGNSVPCGGGGGGGFVYKSSVYLPAGTLTVTVGAGGVGTWDSGNYRADVKSGGASSVGDYVALGGGGGGTNISNGARVGHNGGSGGGGANGTGGSALLGQGNNGVSTGGGGGAGAAGSGTSGGAGLASSITGTSVTYARGGTSGGTSNGAANTGNGADGSYDATAYTGGSGYVVVVTG